jgi:hypothetical protein
MKLKLMRKNPKGKFPFLIFLLDYQQDQVLQENLIVPENQLKILIDYMIN